jgi:endonuclease VIII
MEGPSLVILTEEAGKFKKKKILNAFGNTQKFDTGKLANQVVDDICSKGKLLFILFKKKYLRIHFLMFGSYRIDEEKDRPSRLTLVFRNGIMNFYSCSVRLEDGYPAELNDVSNDVMSENWDTASAVKKILTKKKEMLCDVLLDQEIFAGSGNIIKNEVLFRLRLHPENKIQSCMKKQLRLLADETRNYSLDFYRWKKKYELRKHWLIYKKKTCPRCNIPVILKSTGKLKRRSFFCKNCQKKY